MSRRISLNISLFILSATLYGQQWDWANTVNIPYYPYIRTMRTSVSPAGGAFLAVSHWDQNYGYPDGATIIRLDSTGTEQWRKTFNSAVSLEAIICDRAGNVAVAGTFRDTLETELGGHVSSGQEDGFIALLDSSLQLKWSLQLKGTGSETLVDINFDNNGNFLTTGSFGKMATFSNNTLSTQGQAASIIARITNYGQVLQTIITDSPDTISASGGSRVRCDGAGRIHVLGGFRYNIRIDTMTRFGGSYYGSQYLAGFDQSGKALYVAQVTNGTSKFRELCIDDSSICLSGDGGWTTGGWRMTCAYSQNGKPLWTKQHSGFYFEYWGNGVAHDNGIFYAAGAVGDPNVPSWNYTYSISILYYDRTGNESAMNIKCKGSGSAREIFNIGPGRFLVTGYTPDTVCFGQKTLCNKTGAFFIAMLRMPVSETGVAESNPFSDFVIFPNPSQGIFSIVCNHDISGGAVCIKDISGKTLRQFSSVPTTLDLTGFNSGVYFVCVTVKDRVLTRKIVIN